MTTDTVTSARGAGADPDVSMEQAQAQAPNILSDRCSGTTLSQSRLHVACTGKAPAKPQAAQSYLSTADGTRLHSNAERVGHRKSERSDLQGGPEQTFDICNEDSSEANRATTSWAPIAMARHPDLPPVNGTARSTNTSFGSRIDHICVTPHPGQRRSSPAPSGGRNYHHPHLEDLIR
jgi:hypothetical protein